MEKEIQFEFFQGECASSMHYENGRKSYTFTLENALPTKREPNMVDLFDAASKLMLSSTPEWKDKSLWFNKVNEDYGSFEPIPEAQKKVDELIKGYCRHADCFLTYGWFRSLSCYDNGWQPGRKDSGRPFQPLRGSR